MGKFVVEQKHEVWFRVEVEAESLDSAVELGMSLLNDGEGFPSDPVATDEFWARDVVANVDGFVVLRDGKWEVQ